MGNLKKMTARTGRRYEMRADALKRIVRAPTTVRGKKFELGKDVEAAFGILRLIGGPGRQN